MIIMVWDMLGKFNFLEKYIYAIGCHELRIMSGECIIPQKGGMLYLWLEYVSKYVITVFNI